MMDDINKNSTPTTDAPDVPTPSLVPTEDLAKVPLPQANTSDARQTLELLPTESPQADEVLQNDAATTANNADIQSIDTPDDKPASLTSDASVISHAIDAIRTEDPPEETPSQNDSSTVASNPTDVSPTENPGEVMNSQGDDAPASSSAVDSVQTETSKGPAPSRNGHATVVSPPVNPQVVKDLEEDRAPKRINSPIVSVAYHPLVLGYRGDTHPRHPQIVEVISILSEAGICCCFVQEHALVYYGTGRVPHDWTLCIPDHQFEHAVRLFTSRIDLFETVAPLPLTMPNSLDHKYPRFKAIGRKDFWLLLPAGYCHLDCRPENVEWSLGNLPYPKLSVYMQSLIDTKSFVDLADLVDGMNPPEEWGELNLNLNGYTDMGWLEKRVGALREDGTQDMFIFVDSRPVSQRGIWQDIVRSKQRRMGWKYSPERYATRFRKHGSKDPRTAYRLLV